MSLRYSLDSSALIGAWYRRLPPDVVPSFWDHIDKKVASGEVGCIDEVKTELSKKTDALFVWVKARSGLVVPMSPAILTSAQRIVNAFPTLTQPNSTRDTADPYVIALAECTGATVVTEEQPSATQKRVKIPDVCNALGIACLDVYDFVRAEGWRY